MATAKKSTKTKHKSTAAAKKPAIKSTVRSSKNTRAIGGEYTERPFLTFRLTRQTLYWSLLCALILALGIWVMTINDKVMRIYDQIDSTNMTIDSMDTVKKK